MMKFINAFTGGVMWVAERRAGEYEAAGHRPAAFPDVQKPALAEKMEQLTKSIKPAETSGEPEKKPVKKTVRKVTKK